jgi:glycosyltransferase involved in cell wall biosynthesis
LTVEQLRRTVPGGIGAYTRGLLSGLADVARDGADVNVTLFASRAPGRRAKAADPLLGFDRPVVLSRLPGRVMTRSWDHGLSRVPGGFDIVHSVSLAFPPPRRGSVSHTVVTVHDLAWRRYPEATTARGRKWHETALRRVRDSEARLVVTSGFVAADLISDGVDQERITIIYSGSDHLVAPDPAGTDEVLRNLGVKGEFLLTVGTLEPRKNVQRLLAAYDQVRPTLPEPWPLVVVGPEGWGPTLSRIVDQSGVKFTGAVANGVLAGLYQRARAFAYVPLSEGYGLPPLEAMRHGTPSMVARDVPSVHDLGQAGEPAALMVNPLDVDDIAQGLTTILTDEARRADLGRRGQTYALTRRWRDAAQSHLTLWGSMV